MPRCDVMWHGDADWQSTPAATRHARSSSPQVRSEIIRLGPMGDCKDDDCRLPLLCRSLPLERPEPGHGRRAARPLLRHRPRRAGAEHRSGTGRPAGGRRDPAHRRQGRQLAARSDGGAARQARRQQGRRDLPARPQERHRAGHRAEDRDAAASARLPPVAARVRRRHPRAAEAAGRAAVPEPPAAPEPPQAMQVPDTASAPGARPSRRCHLRSRCCCNNERRRHGGAVSFPHAHGSRSTRSPPQRRISAAPARPTWRTPRRSARRRPSCPPPARPACSNSGMIIAMPSILVFRCAPGALPRKPSQRVRTLAQ